MTLAGMYGKYKAPLRFCMLLIGLGFIAYLAKSSWSETAQLTSQMNVAMFAVSLLIGLVGNLATALYFSKMLYKHGALVEAKLAVKVYFAGQVAKYIPGKIFGIAFQISHVKGASQAAAVILANFEIMFGSLWIITMVAVTLFALTVSAFWALICFVTGLVVFAWIYKTNGINATFQRIAAKFNAFYLIKDTSPGATRLSDGAIIYVFFATSYVAANLAMLVAVFEFTLAEASVYIVLLSVAWIIGVFALIVPAGMGVREVAFITISSSMLSNYSIELLTTIAVLSRLWLIILEVTGFLLSMMIRTKTTDIVLEQ